MTKTHIFYILLLFKVNKYKIKKTILPNRHFKVFITKIAFKTKIAPFYFENFNFLFLKFETISPKLYPLTLNPKSRLVNPRIKIHFQL